MLYNLAASSAFITMCVKPVKAQRGSLDVVRKAFDIFMLIRHCNLLYTLLLHSFSSASIHTGAPYNSSGRIAPLYMVYNASWLSPSCVLQTLIGHVLILYAYLCVHNVLSEV